MRKESKYHIKCSLCKYSCKRKETLKKHNNTKHQYKSEESCDKSKEYEEVLDLFHLEVVSDEEVYMGGLALMAIAPKKWEFLPTFMSTLLIIKPHLKSFINFI